MFKIKKNLSLNILVVGVLIGTLLLTLFSVAQNYGLIGKDLSKDKFSFLMPNNAVYLYAETEPNTYTIYFDGNGWEWTMNNMSMTYDNSENLLKNEFEKEWYVFKWWSRTKAWLVKYLDQSEVKNLTATNSGKVTLYAQREPEFPYTVEYYIYRILNYSNRNNVYMIYMDRNIIYMIYMDKNIIYMIYPNRNIYVI